MTPETYEDFLFLFFFLFFVEGFFYFQLTFG